MTATPEPRPSSIDAAINHPTRLTVVAFLSACDEAEFATVRGSCQVSDSMLSKIASALEAIGYLTVRKGYVGKRPRTWLSLTPTGQEALARHIAALQDIAATARNAGIQATAVQTQETGGPPHSS
ncbi:MULTISPECIES: winged helix-turn-helix domain-containing protein [unclassified Streptomyces]|uniref:winged helix-turn-helix domain-containing protein n=1 Tax=unclassified Streptomyces TaxID=2593676 RepID=UPI002E2B4D5D|nr:transcriptional regulator [Streptomyces sp. NBC_01429]